MPGNVNTVAAKPQKVKVHSICLRARICLAISPKSPTETHRLVRGSVLIRPITDQPIP